MALPTEATGRIIPFRRRGPSADRVRAYLRFWSETFEQLSDYLGTPQTQERSQMSDIAFDYRKTEPSKSIVRINRADTLELRKAGQLVDDLAREIAR